jgi:hypothetical protein
MMFGWEIQGATHTQEIMSHLILAHLVPISGILVLMIPVLKTIQPKLIMF